MKNVVSEVLKINDEQVLRQLNNLIVGKLNSIRDNKSLNVMANLRIGQKVQFEGKHGRTVVGTVSKFNQKTVNVETPNGGWRVAASLLSPHITK